MNVRIRDELGKPVKEQPNIVIHVTIHHPLIKVNKSLANELFLTK